MILTIVAGHYWRHDTAFLNSVAVNFCFVYSGYFTARRHTFGSDYSLRQHAALLWKKLAKLYPLHLLGIVLGIAGAFLSWGSGGISPQALIAHLTLTSSWIPNPSYYFGANPVAWFLCDLFFLQLVSPLVVRGLRLMNLRWQVALIAALLALQFAVGYSPETGGPSRAFGIYTNYMLYYFPPMRLLDFATGIVIYHIGKSTHWASITHALNERKCTVIEITSVVVFIALYWVGKLWLHPHCYRAYCTSAAAIVALLGAFVLTNGHGGFVSRLLDAKPLAVLSTIVAELYLLQFGTHQCLIPLYRHWDLMAHPVIYLIVRIAVLIAIALLTHRLFTIPIYHRLTSQRLR